jgi:hypothetical protein
VWALLGDVVELYDASSHSQFDKVSTHKIILNMTEIAGNNAPDTLIVSVEAAIPESGATWAVVLSVLSSSSVAAAWQKWLLAVAQTAILEGLHSKNEGGQMVRRNIRQMR